MEAYKFLQYFSIENAILLKEAFINGLNQFYAIPININSARDKSRFIQLSIRYNCSK